MKILSLAVSMVLLVAGTATASMFDFRDAATFGGALNQPSFSAGVDANTVTLTAMPTGARLWWDDTDGLGVRYLYESDEIAGIERLRIAFSAPVQIVRVYLSDLFNEGYLERGAYQLNGSGSWFSFSADSGQVPGSTNGELALALDSNVMVSSILFRSPGPLLLLKQNHEFSVAAIETTAVPIPGAVWLLGSGLLGLVGLKRKFRK